MAEELFVKLSDVNALLPNCCEICREQIEDLHAIKLDGERLNEVRRLLERVNDDANRLMRWANQPFDENVPLRPLTPLQARQVSERIQSHVEKSFGLESGALLRRTNVREVVWPRQIAIYIIRKLTLCAFPEIAKYFDSHHTTVIHSYKKISERIPEDKKLVELIKAIAEAVGPGR
jgi:chromosomal replication initiation ATPase DnaA